MLTASVPVYDLAAGEPVPASIMIRQGTDEAGRPYRVMGSTGVLYLVREGLPTRFVVLDDLLAAMVRAEHAPDSKGGR